MNTPTRLDRIRAIAGAVGEIAATAVLIFTAVLAAVLIVGTIHLYTEIW